MTELKLLVIGIDGATFDIIKPLISEGRLPNFKRLMDEGVHGNLRSTVPPMTAPAWICLMTGMNPGQHGILDFRKINILSAEQTVDFEYGREVCAGKTFWEKIENKRKGKSAVLFVPMTYPVWKINGIFVAGFPAPNSAKGFAYPPELYPEYKECNLPMDESLLKNKDKTIRLNSETIKRISSKIIERIKEKKYECIFAVFKSIDDIQHIFWHLIQPDLYKEIAEKEIQKYGNTIEAFYEKIDLELGGILEEINSKTTLFVVSDHGAGHAPFYEFNTSYWLEQAGFSYAIKKGRLNKFVKGILRKYERSFLFYYISKMVRKLPSFLRTKARALGQDLDVIDFTRSKAFRVRMFYPCEGIVINLMNRQKHGCVPEEDYEKVRSEIIERVVNVRDPKTGEKIVLKAQKREELYYGEKVGKIPDIILTLNGFYQGGMSKNCLVSEIPKDIIYKRPGKHTEYGIFIAKGEYIRKNISVDGVSIMEVAPTILYSSGIPIPKYMKGKVLQEIFEESFRKDNPIRIEEEEKITREEVEIGEREKKEIEEQLRGLGYLE